MFRGLRGNNGGYLKRELIRESSFGRGFARSKKKYLLRIINNLRNG